MTLNSFAIVIKLRVKCAILVFFFWFKSWYSNKYLENDIKCLLEINKTVEENCKKNI